MNITGIAIFAITYLLIAGRRLDWLPLDRPAAALLGAAAAVAFGALSPHEAQAAIDGGTLILLFGMMGLGAFLALDGFFDVAGPWLVRRAHTAVGLLGWVVWPAGILSALITNDAVALLAAPVVIRVCRAQNLPTLPYLLALASACNTGSVATLVGNPQNMLCASLGGLDYARYALAVGPVAVASLALNHAWLWWLYRRSLANRALRSMPAVKLSTRAWISLLGLASVAIAYLLGADLPWTASAGFAALLMVHRRDTRGLWGRIDWPLLLFFCGLFVVVEAFSRSGAPAAFFDAWPLRSLADQSGGSWALAGIFLVGSNLVSNVPFILVIREAMGTLPHPEAAWTLLAMASTFAGNLTLLGSVANIIVAEAARDEGGLGFAEHLRVGAPVALSSTAVGTAWLLWWFSIS